MNEISIRRGSDYEEITVDDNGLYVATADYDIYSVSCKDPDEIRQLRDALTTWLVEKGHE